MNTNQSKAAYILTISCNAGAGDEGIERCIGVTLSGSKAREWEKSPATDCEIETFKPYYHGRINVIKEVLETQLLE